MERKHFKIGYGPGRIGFQIPVKNLLPGRWPTLSPPSINVAQALLQGLEAPIGCAPIRDWVRGGMRVCLVCDDYTRPTPTHLLLPPLLNHLHKLGIRDKDITLLVAAGVHRRMTAEELVDKYGRRIVERIPILHHNPEGELINLGQTSQGFPMWVNRLAVETDVLIGIGLVEIHPWAGFAGGCKIVCPGVAGRKTITTTHALPARAENVEIGVTEGNPFWEACCEVACVTKLRLVINVVLNRYGQIAGVFVGEPVTTQKRAIEFFKRINRVVFPERPDIVIASANPKFQCWGQCTVAIFNATRIVRPGGVRIVLGACTEGFGDSEGERRFYLEALRRKWSSPEECWEETRGVEDENSRNASALYRHLQHLKHSRLIFVTDGFPADTGELASLDYCQSIEEAIEQAFRELGSSAKVGVLDNGAMILPQVESNSHSRLNWFFTA